MSVNHKLTNLTTAEVAALRPALRYLGGGEWESPAGDVFDSEDIERLDGELAAAYLSLLDNPAAHAAELAKGLEFVSVVRHEGSTWAVDECRTEVGIYQIAWRQHSPDWPGWHWARKGDEANYDMPSREACEAAATADFQARVGSCLRSKT
jgi:hypothetical protein